MRKQIGATIFYFPFFFLLPVGAWKDIYFLFSSEIKIFLNFSISINRDGCGDNCVIELGYFCELGGFLVRLQADRSVWKQVQGPPWWRVRWWKLSHRRRMRSTLQGGRRVRLLRQWPFLACIRRSMRRRRPDQQQRVQHPLPAQSCIWLPKWTALENSVLI